MEDIRGTIGFNFHFLENFGYVAKVYERNGDVEVCYSKNGLDITIRYYLGFYDVKRWKTKYYVILMIDNSLFQRVLLDCDNLFGKEKIDKLKSDISFKTIIEQIAIYAEFIKSNIEVLNQIEN